MWTFLMEDGVKDEIWNWILVRGHERFPKWYNTWLWDLRKCLKSYGWVVVVGGLYDYRVYFLLREKGCDK